MASFKFIVSCVVLLALSVSALDPPRTITADGQYDLSKEVAKFDNVYILLNTGSNRVTFSVEDSDGEDIVDSVICQGKCSYSLAEVFWFDDDVKPGQWTITFSGITSGNVQLYELIQTGSIQYEVNPPKVTGASIPCHTSGTPSKLRDFFYVVENVEKDAYFRFTLDISGSPLIKGLYADDNVFPGTDCPQADDFNDDKCEFAARSDDDSKRTHEINSAWSPSGNWYFRLHTSSCSNPENTDTTVSVQFSDATATTISAFVLAVVGFVAMML